MFMNFFAALILFVINESILKLFFWFVQDETSWLSEQYFRPNTIQIRIDSLVLFQSDLPKPGMYDPATFQDPDPEDDFTPLLTPQVCNFSFMNFVVAQV